MRWTMGWALVLAGGLAMVAPGASAQRPPETHPASEQRDVVQGWDRSAVPGDIELWAPRTMLAHSHADTTLEYGYLHLVCASRSDARQGRCPTEGSADSAVGLRAVPVLFTEARSGMTVELAVQGGIQRLLSGRSCTRDYWQPAILAPWSSHALNCGADLPAGTGGQLSVPGRELQRLVAGIWTGTLSLQARTPSGGVLAAYTFRFRFTVTDRNAVAIYLPEFDHATPSVGLDLRYSPFAQTIEGRKVLDMCLYDGLGSQSTYLGVTARDNSGRPPGATGFSVWHSAGGSGERQRVDYTATLDYNGTAVAMANGVEQRLSGIDTARLRLVMLPGMTQPVFCVPTPLTLATPRFPSTSKDAGYYVGQLQLELRVPTFTP
ncbi:CfaE/CblD family pilus tip adhesin [Stenotrophomonas sp. 24(2023)]|uniref:CfaE/CblD family pilus tip adhesin n=1 Tax=Stenotrophomonas sp. 24(2023) TaxID=3068324 RepID=UPI0027DF5C7F|nr:CfaE/CblD family pilus tip adhesin [Stenotrophomonas sp. 24(2023)]WMJ70352.1 CfaE/CblD family pilus tip adhesin [Stenotrophomonas sp. 24(2023)]